MKVLMLPHLSHFRSEESGIKRVVEAYFKYLPQFDIELVSPDTTSYDLKAVHAGMTGGDCDIAHLHGIYWTADYDAPMWEYDANAKIVEAVRQAKSVTVPSSWVAETFRRDMRFSPHIVPHGIEWEEWQHNLDNLGYVLWNKNRVGDVCSPDALNYLSRRFIDTPFLSTFGVKRANTTILDGVVVHEDMKRLIQQAAVYLSTAKETFGIGVLEAMAAGVPVLGWAYGGNLGLVEHGVNGYLAVPGDLEDLSEGLDYCYRHRDVLGNNGQEMVKKWTWEKACEKIATVYQHSMQTEYPTVGVVIPVYNKSFEEIKRAIDSVNAQTIGSDSITLVVIDDGSQDIDDRLEGYCKANNVVYYYQNNQGVANARNNGISQLATKYVCCLDSDDWLDPRFLETCVKELEEDKSLSIAYAGLWYHKPDGEEGLSPWPTEWTYDNHLKKQNQVPTCCVFRREMWERLGGYRQRYAPRGAGAEDAEFFLRAGAYGFKGKKVTDEGLFHYSWLSGQVTGDPDYQEVDWLAWHPWVYDKQYPFASYATPEKLSHPVRQYDEPIISVIIPVGPGHEQQVINALDSLEAQTFRKWEVIVIWDMMNDPDIDTVAFNYCLCDIETAYPYVKEIWTSCKGAGFARNRGVEIARAPFILFLDADDTLHPEALEKMLSYWNRYEEGIYPDYIGQAYIDDELALKLQNEQRLEAYNADIGEALILYESFDFDCKRAKRQPETDLYIWNLITTLIPKVWHEEIGGFDESMETWEDWEYWLRMVHNGKCFTRLPERLVRYRFYTGSRRDRATPDTPQGRQVAQKMIQYIKDKLEGIESVGCNCGGKKKNNPMSAVIRGEVEIAQGQDVMATDDNFVECKYVGPHGKRNVTGAHRFNQDPGLPSRRIDKSAWVLYYGYLSHGNIISVHKEDVRLMIGKWEPIPRVVTPPISRQLPSEPQPIAPVVEAPKVSDLAVVSQMTTGITLETEQFDLQKIPGIGGAIAKGMKAAGLDTKEKILQASPEQLISIKGLTEARVRAIRAYLSQ